MEEVIEVMSEEALVPKAESVSVVSSLEMVSRDGRKRMGDLRLQPHRLH